MLKLFEQPEIPSDNVQYLHFITDTLKSIHETLDFLSSQSAELDDLIHQHIDSDSQFRSRLFIWRKELLNWQSFVQSAQQCQCELHSGQTSVDDYMERRSKGRSFVDRPKDCVVFIPRMFASNKEAYDRVKHEWKTYWTIHGDAQSPNKYRKFMPNDIDLAAELIVKAGWMMCLVGNPQSPTIPMSLYIFDYDKGSFVPLFSAAGGGSIGWELMRMLVNNRKSDTDQALFTKILTVTAHTLLGTTAVRQSAVMPNYIVPFANGDYNIVFQRLSTPSMFHIPACRFDIDFVDNPQPLVFGQDKRTYEEIVDDWCYVPSTGQVNQGRRITLHQIALQTLLGYNFQEKIFFLVGEGSDGKSTFARLLTSIIGTDNVSNSTTADIFAGDANSHEHKKALNSAHAIISSDAPSDLNFKESGALKSLASGETLTVVPKYQSVTPVNFSGMILQMTNSLPEFDGALDESKLRRLGFVTFQNPQNRTGRIDTGLAQQLRSKGAAEYIASYYVRGLSPVGLSYNSMCLTDNEYAVRVSNRNDSAADFVEWLEDMGALNGAKVPYLPRTVFYKLYLHFMEQEFPGQIAKTARGFWLAIEPLLKMRGYSLVVGATGRKKTYSYESFRLTYGQGFEEVFASMIHGLDDEVTAGIFESRGRDHKTEAYAYNAYNVSPTYSMRSKIVHDVPLAQYLGYGPDYQLFLEMIGQSDDDFTASIIFDPSQHLFETDSEEKNGEIEEARIILQRLHTMGQTCQEASAEEKAHIILALKSFAQNSTYGRAVRDILGQYLFGDIFSYAIDLQGEDMSKITPTTVLAFPWDSLNQVLSAVTLDQLIDVD